MNHPYRSFITTGVTERNAITRGGHHRKLPQRYLSPRSVNHGHRQHVARCCPMCDEPVDGQPGMMAHYMKSHHFCYQCQAPFGTSDECHSHMRRLNHRWTYCHRCRGSFLSSYNPRSQFRSTSRNMERSPTSEAWRNYQWDPRGYSERVGNFDEAEGIQEVQRQQTRISFETC